MLRQIISMWKSGHISLEMFKLALQFNVMYQIISVFFISYWPSLVSVLRFVSLTISYYKSLPGFDHIEVINSQMYEKFGGLQRVCYIIKSSGSSHPENQDVPKSTPRFKKQ